MASTWEAEVADHRLRLLGWAVLASLVLHALLLFALPLFKEAKRQIPTALTARLAPKPPEPVPAAPEVLPIAPQPKPAVARPAPIVKAVPLPVLTVPTPAPVALPSIEPAKPAAEAAIVAPAAPQAAVSRAEAQAALQAASGPDPGTVARFRLELMDLARRYKKYPRIAQDNNWEGRVELRIAIGEDGAISSLTVRKSAGRSVLDDEAQAMIRTAKSKATIPPALRGKVFVLEVAVDFFLKDEGR